METNHQSEKYINYSPVVNFYSEKSIFLTGATGFLGMVVLEKLLFECEDIKKIYVLIKQKHEKSVEDRLTSIFSTQAFERIKEKNADILQKVVPIVGNLLEESIGLSDENIQTLRTEVSIVFHLAANINFDKSVVEAIRVNTCGTKNVVQLCKGMEQLSAFVYVSTAFSNSHKNVIDEKIYKTGYNFNSVLYAAEELKDSHLADCLLEGRPNSYVFSKALAEEVIATELNGIPVAIIRPSIITSAVKDPLPNWVYGWNGANYIAVGVGTGVIRCFHGDPEVVCDVIPVDKVSNLSIVAAWDVYKESETSNSEVKVFNCCSGIQNPLTYRKMLGSLEIYGRKHYSVHVVIPPMLLIIKNFILYNILFFIMHTIPAYIFEGIQWLLLRERRSLHIHRKIIQQGRVFNYFCLNNFLFFDYNVRELFLRIDKNDKRKFDFNIKDIDWDAYIQSYVLGIKKYLLKET